MCQKKNVDLSFWFWPNSVLVSILVIPPFPISPVTQMHFRSSQLTRIQHNNFMKKTKTLSFPLCSVWLVRFIVHVDSFPFSFIFAKLLTTFSILKFKEPQKNPFQFPKKLHIPNCHVKLSIRHCSKHMCCVRVCHSLCRMITSSDVLSTTYFFVISTFD